MESKLKTTSAVVYNDSGTAVAMNDDVLIEILLHLPAKSLTRLKLVCKKWLSIISGDLFCRLHTLRHSKPLPFLLLRLQPSVALRWHYPQFSYFNPIINGEMMIPYNFTLPDPEILSSCYGLLLLQCDNPQTDYYVYNLTTKQSRKIIVDHDPEYPTIMGLHLAFDPSKSAHYKIVCIRADERAEDASLRLYQIKVYESESRTWKLCLESFTASSKMNFSSGVHCNNLIYGKTLYGSFYYFDIDNNIIRFLPRPRTLTELAGSAKYCCSQLQESNGCLYYIAMVLDLKGESVALWELVGDDHSQWFLKYRDRISHPRVSGRAWGPTIPLRLMTAPDGGEMCSLVMYQSGKIRIYSFLDKSYKELVQFSRRPFIYQEDSETLCSVYQFGESLVPA